MEEHPDADRGQTGAKLELGEFVLHLQLLAQCGGEAKVGDALPRRKTS
jgi:hypothetical protein